MEMRIHGELIKSLRLKRSWSQERLADSAGVSMRTIQRMESEGVASLQSRDAVAHALEIDPAELLVFTEPAITDIQDEHNQLRNLTIAWSQFLRPVLRYSLLAALWAGMVFILFLILATLVSGLFFWESMNMTFWESTGQGIIGAFFFAPFLALLYYLYRRLTCT